MTLGLKIIKSGLFSVNQMEATFREHTYVSKQCDQIPAKKKRKPISEEKLTAPQEST